MFRKSKRKLEAKNIFIIIVLISLFYVSGFYVFRQNINPKVIDQSGETVDSIQDEDYRFSMVMVGDNLIHSSVYKDAMIGDNQYDFTKMYEFIKPIVSKYDIGYYNQETILGGKELGLRSYPTFNSPQEVGDAMIDAGFNLVSLATNHTMDAGERAIVASRKYWDSKEDVLAVGSYTSDDERNQIHIMEKNHITYTMLNYTYGTNGIAVPKGKEYLVNVWPTDFSINDVARDTKYQEYKEQVKLDIEKVRNQVDVLIVAMHWGTEYTHEPTAYEKDMASYLASLGVDIIIGTHPHVVQPVTWIDNTLVIYSLGNFISAQYQDNNYNKMVGLMTSLEIHKQKKGEQVQISIENVSNELLYTYYKNWRGFKVVPFSNEKIGNYLSDYKNVYERYKKVVQKYDSSVSVKPLSE